MLSDITPKNLYLATLLTAVVSLQSACSWQNTVYAIASSPGYLRLDDNTVVEGAPRFRLPADAGLSIYADQSSPPAWLEPASLGVAEVFGPHSHHRKYLLRVSWPVAKTPQEAEQEGDDGFTLQVPGPAEVGRLPIQLTDNYGNTIAKMTLHISPALWGADWQDPTHLQSSFRHLAETLRDG